MNRQGEDKEKIDKIRKVETDKGRTKRKYIQKKKEDEKMPQKSHICVAEKARSEKVSSKLGQWLPNSKSRKVETDKGRTRRK